MELGRWQSSTYIYVCVFMGGGGGGGARHMGGCNMQGGGGGGGGGEGSAHMGMLE